MSTERIMMMCKLSEAEQQRKRLQLKGEALCATIRQDISPVLNSLDAMDIPRAAQKMDELVLVHAELLGLSMQIDRLKKELGHGQ